MSTYVNTLVCNLKTMCIYIGNYIHRHYIPPEDSLVLRMIDNNRLDLAIITSIGAYYNSDPILMGLFRGLDSSSLLM